MNPLDKNVYEAIARKDLSFGCIITSNEFHISKAEEVEGKINVCMYFSNQGNIRLQWFYVHCPLTEEQVYFDFTDVLRYTIKGHPILLSDVMNWGGDKTGTFQYYWDLSLPTYDEQSEECKEFIRNLVK